ncbi:probable 4-coumarate--CoA ligase 1 [Diaphorina citri]|uniref:Probable 4-coumarate--CoA ligase 1 n=1 Tax=Diaphorina citri TaxID=121845 RepID=A0A3Q0IPI0_DIACI|nr:probable 4-coumarate--CoA ligase 1 [Diaphorina citri]
MERSNRKMLGILPFYHIYGLLVMLDCLCNGSTVVSMSKFSPSVFTDNISKHQISLLSIVPSLLLPLVKCTAEDLSSLNLIFIGGSVTNGSLMSALLEKFLDDSLEIYNIYGMTEASGIISWAKMSTKDIDESREKGESIGRMPKIFQSKVLEIQFSPSPL